MSKISASLRDYYARAFSSKHLSPANDFILQFCLKARGYNNSADQDISGENYVIEEVLKKLEPRVCVDVGANVGKYASALLSHHLDSIVYAFEPLAAPFSELNSLRDTFGERMIAINKGVGQRNGNLQIHYNETATSHASFASENKNISFISNEKSVDVEVVTLDSFFSEQAPVEQIDFIKIDTEGFEYEVLTGAENTIRKFRPKMIQIEHNIYHMLKGQPMYLFAQLMEDYELFQLLPRRLAKRAADDPINNIHLFSNFLFVRQDLTKTLGL